MPIKIKKSRFDEGGFFDPHTHFTGIIPYRVLAMLTDEGRQLLTAWRRAAEAAIGRTSQVSPGLKSAVQLADHQLEDFFAHHTINTVLKPPHRQATAEQAELAKVLYELETRLLILQNFALAWGFAKISDDDRQRVRDNAGTLEAIIKDGCNLVAVEIRKVSVEVAEYGTPPPSGRPDSSEMPKIIDGVLNLQLTLDKQDDYETGLPKLVRHANQNALTATPQNDFDSAYVAQGLLAIPIEVRLAAGMREIKRQNIAYSEQSVPLWTFPKWRNDSQGDMAARAVEDHEATGTVVRWLPMLVGGFLGWTGDDTRTMLRLRGTVPKTGEKRPELPATALTDVSPYAEWTATWTVAVPLTWPKVTPGKTTTVQEDMADWTARLRTALRDGVRYAAGFDIASPERTWYTPAGRGLLEELLLKTFEVARQERRRIIAHIHVGEGYPAFAEGAMAKLQATAKRREQATIPILYDETTKLPAHYLCAENNVEMMLRAVQGVRLALKQRGGRPLVAAFDEHVRVRFGHVTHASLIQAQQMADNNIWADVNLTSNLATGAVSLSGSSDGMVAVPQNPGLIKWAAQEVAKEDTAVLFKQHALATLLACRVPTVLGTDGGGIEHSFMEREYALARAVLEQAVRRVADNSFTILSSAKMEQRLQLTDEAAAALKERLDVTRLYEYQHAHHAWATTPPSQTTTPIAPIAAPLDRELHSVFLDSIADSEH